MDTLRQRNPFKYSSDYSASDDTSIMDEQEQSEHIDNLKRLNAISSNQNRTMLQITLALSILLHIIYIFSDYNSPLVAVFPPAGRPDTPLYLSPVLALLAILLHVNTVLLIQPRDLVIGGRQITPVPYNIALALSAVSPIISVLSGRTWQTTAWWCTAAFLTWIVRAANRWIIQGHESISSLERLKYTYAGA